MFNSKDGYIQDHTDSRESKWPVPFVQIFDEATEDNIIQFNFGDLLNMPSRLLLKWEKYYIRAQTPIEGVRRILFPTTKADIKFIQQYWKKRKNEYSQSIDFLA